MPTAAIAAYGSQLRLGDGIPLGAVTVIAATNTAPIVLTTSPAHGIVDVTRVTVAGVAGNLGANGSWVAERVTATTLKLRGSVGTGVYTTGGTVTPTNTFTTIAEMRDLNPIGFTFRMEDVSAHDGNGWSSSIPTEKVGPNMRLDINYVPSIATHNATTGLLYLAMNRLRRDWLVVFPDVGRTTIFLNAWVSDHGAQTPVSGVLRATPTLTVDGAMTYTIA